MVFKGTPRKKTNRPQEKMKTHPLYMKQSQKLRFFGAPPPQSASRSPPPPHPHMAMRQNPVPPVNIPIPTKISSKLGGEFTYQPKWDPKTVLTTTATSSPARLSLAPVVSACRKAAQWAQVLELLRHMEATHLLKGICVFVFFTFVQTFFFLYCWF